MAEVQDALFACGNAPPLPTSDCPTRTCAKCGKPKALAEFTQKGMSWGRWCKECVFDYGLWRWYRLTRADYDAMLAEQLGRCALCLEPFGEMRPHVDHDHNCDHPDRNRIKSRPNAQCCRACVRALLCHRCNHFIGYLEKRGHLLEAALRYTRHDAQPQEEAAHVR